MKCIVEANWRRDEIVRAIFESKAPHFEIYFSTKRGNVDETDYPLYFELAFFNPHFQIFTAHCERIMMERSRHWTHDDIFETLTFSRNNVGTPVEFQNLLIFTSLHPKISPFLLKTMIKWQIHFLMIHL